MSGSGGRLCGGGAETVDEIDMLKLNLIRALQSHSSLRPRLRLVLSAASATALAARGPQTATPALELELEELEPEELAPARVRIASMTWLMRDVLALPSRSSTLGCPYARPRFAA